MDTVICFGEMLLRLNPAAHRRVTQAQELQAFYGGSEANVAALLSQLAVKSAFVSKVPANELGQAAVHTLQTFGVATDHVLIGGKRLGVYFAEIGSGARPSKVIYDREHSAFSELVRGEIPWKEIFGNASWFHWSGISAAVSQSAADVCLEALEAAKSAGIKVSVDFNYRSKLWGYGKKASMVMPELLSYCDTIVCDFDSAKIYLGIEPAAISDPKACFPAFCDQLRERLPQAKQIAMSFRGRNSSGHDSYCGALNTAGGSYYSAEHLLGEVVDRIGSGDAFTAGLLYGLLNNLEALRTIDFATACGLIKHSILGDFAIATQDEINQFLDSKAPRGGIIR